MKKILSFLMATILIFTLSNFNVKAGTQELMISLEKQIIAIDESSQMEIYLYEEEEFTPLDITELMASTEDEYITLDYDAEYIEISEDGLVTGIAEGETVIYVEYINGEETILGEIDVIVSNDRDLISLDLNVENDSLNVGNETNLIINLVYSNDDFEEVDIPTAIENGELMFESYNEDVFEIDELGMIKAIGNGISKLIVTYYYGEDQSIHSELIINVGSIIGVIGIEAEVDNTELSIDDTANISVSKIMTGETFELLDVQSIVDEGTEEQINFESSDEGVAEVDEYGQITAISGGEANVLVNYYIDEMEYSSELKISVINPVVSIEASLNKKSFKKNESATLIIEKTYEDGTVQDFNDEDYDLALITSSNEKVATVDDLGKIKAVGPGKSIITVEYSGDEEYFTSSVSVTVLKGVVSLKSLKLDKTKYSLKANKYLSYKINGLYSDSSKKDLKKSVKIVSSKKGIVSIGSKGVKGLKKGSVKLTFSIGTIKTSCLVTVSK